MKFIYLKCDSFDVTIGIKILFFRVSVTFGLGRSLLQFVTTNCLIFLNRAPSLINIPTPCLMNWGEKNFQIYIIDIIPDISVLLLVTNLLRDLQLLLIFLFKAQLCFYYLYQIFAARSLF